MSFNRVREFIASNIRRFHHVRSEDNTAGILSKHWSYNYVWKLMKQILFWRQDTALIPNDDNALILDNDTKGIKE